jgi:hypothetical protein
MSNDACSHSNSLDEPLNMLVSNVPRREKTDLGDGTHVEHRASCVAD